MKRISLLTLILIFVLSFAGGANADYNPDGDREVVIGAPSGNFEKFPLDPNVQIEKKKEFYEWLKTKTGNDFEYSYIYIVTKDGQVILAVDPPTPIP